MKTLITGVAGAGKTTIAAELINRGYDAINMDYYPGLSAWVNLNTGIPDPNFKIASADDWEGKYDWLWDDSTIKTLLQKNSNTYFCGGSGNQSKYYSFFTKIFFLEMDEALIKDRILNNREHDYGRRPGELDQILGYYEDFQNSIKAAGAIVINPRNSIENIVDLILAETL